MKLTKQKQQHLIVVAAITLVLCGGIWFGMIRSQNRRLAETVNKVDQARAKQSDMRKLINNRERIAAELEASSQKIAQIENTFADGADLYSWFFLKLPEFKATAAVETPQIDRPVAGDMSLLPEFPYQQATYAIRGSGYFEELGQFISNLENRFPYFRLLNLEVDSDAGASADGEKLNFRVQVATLIKPAP